MYIVLTAISRIEIETKPTENHKLYGRRPLATHVFHSAFPVVLTETAGEAGFSPPSATDERRPAPVDGHVRSAVPDGGDAGRAADRLAGDQRRRRRPGQHAATGQGSAGAHGAADGLIRKPARLRGHQFRRR